MPLTLITTPGLATSNSYCSVAEADDYHAFRLHAETWLAASADDKKAALAWATRTLDALVVWEGWPQYPTVQVLRWPRAGLMNRDETAYLDNFTIPLELKQATAEFARQLMEADRTLDSDVETQGLRSLTAGPVSLSFKDDVRAKVLPDAVRSLLVANWVSDFGGTSADFREVDVERV